MRTTIQFEPDVAAALEKARADEGRGLSEAVNLLIRRGLLARPPAPPFRQSVEPLGLSIDVRDVAEALEILEGPAEP